MSPDPFEYDIAVSFASQDRPPAEQLAGLLAGRDIRVFLDEYNPDTPGGGQVLDHLVNLCHRKARYCVLLVSRHYPLKSWTQAERVSVQERAFRDAQEYILPIRLDDSPIPGMTESAGGRDLESLATLLEEKLSQARKQDGPPSQSHDLRSGNVPSERDEPGA